MKLKVVPPEEYGARGVPDILVRAVNIINECIAIDAKAATEALNCGDYAFPEMSQTYKKFEQHPSIVIGQVSARNTLPCISGLGILNGILMTERFRLYIQTEDDDYLYKFAGIMEDLDGAI